MGLRFLRDLGRHQDRAWFEAHRDVYETSLRDPLLTLVGALADEFARRRLPLRADPRRSVFRIHRDVRFSLDKRPYKTHVAAVLTRDGGKATPGMLYVHVDPTGSFAATGTWRPEPAQLQVLRTAIVTQPAPFRAMVRALARRGVELDVDDEALKRLPRGYEGVTDDDLAAALRRRSFVIHRPLAPERVGRPELFDDLVAFVVASTPLLRYIWSVLGAVD